MIPLTISTSDDQQFATGTATGTATYPPRRSPRPSGCACGLPRSEYEGHNCPAREWQWTRWPS